MSKENTMSKTLEIKTSMLKSRESPLEQLFFHIKDGNFIRFKNIFDRNKFLIESIDEHKNTLLNIAVQCSNYEISKYLLINGAKVNTQNVYYFLNQIYLNSPLHYALSFKNYNIANLLISKKADEELKNSYGFTPWQCIAISQHV